jgi:hypothetical protein
MFDYPVLDIRTVNSFIRPDFKPGRVILPCVSSAFGIYDDTIPKIINIYDEGQADFLILLNGSFLITAYTTALYYIKKVKRCFQFRFSYTSSLLQLRVLKTGF